jgi:hypothetical protein
MEAFLHQENELNLFQYVQAWKDNIEDQTPVSVRYCNGGERQPARQGCGQQGASIFYYCLF